MLTVNDVMFIKRYCKAYLTPYVYALCKKFNNTSNTFRFVITGGDAISYYINSVDVLSKDFDIKIVYKHFDDWKAFSDHEPFETILQYLPKMKERRELFLNEFYTTVFHSHQGKSSLFEQALHKACSIISANNKYGEHLTYSDIAVERTKAPFFGLLVKKRKLRNLSTEDQKAWKWSYEQYKAEGDIGRISFVYSFKLHTNTQTHTVDEGLIDCNCWSPTVYGYTRIYKSRSYQPIVDFINPHRDVYELLVDQDDFQEYQSAFIFRNFSFIEIEGLCIISISYLLWDTVRMANVTYNKILTSVVLQKNKNRKRPVKLNQASVAYHAKYVKKYWEMIQSLFSKLRCIKPFTDAMERCANDPLKDDVEGNLQNSLQQLSRNYIKMQTEDSDAEDSDAEDSEGGLDEEEDSDAEGSEGDLDEEEDSDADDSKEEVMSDIEFPDIEIINMLEDQRRRN